MHDRIARAGAGIVAALVVSLSGCCFGDFAEGFRRGFDESFCASYQTSFVDACVSTCVGTAGEPARATCTTGCRDALARDSTWVSRCASATTPTPPTPAVPPPG